MHYLEEKFSTLPLYSQYDNDEIINKSENEVKDKETRRGLSSFMLLRSMEESFSVLPLDRLDANDEIIKDRVKIFKKNKDKTINEKNIELNLCIIPLKYSDWIDIEKDTKNEEHLFIRNSSKIN